MVGMALRILESFLKGCSGAQVWLKQCLGLWAFSGLLCVLTELGVVEELQRIATKLLRVWAKG